MREISIQSIARAGDRLKVVILDIDVIFQHCDIIDGAINNVYNEDGTVNKMEYQEYNDFVTNVWMCLQLAGFVDAEEYEDSPNSITSKYFTMYKPETNESPCIKCVSKIRVSDHALDPKSAKAQRTYMVNQRSRLEEKLGKPIHTITYRTVIVNGSQYDSYDDALADVEKRIKTCK